MTELVHPAGDMGKLAAKRTFEAYVSFSTAVSEVCQILGYEHEIMGILVQKNKKEEEIAFVEGQGSTACKNGSTGQTAQQAACAPRAAWDAPPQPPHALLGREDVSSLGRPSPAPTCSAGQGGCEQPGTPLPSPHMLCWAGRMSLVALGEKSKLPKYLPN